jgi:hypothetical protein
MSIIFTRKTNLLNRNDYNKLSTRRVFFPSREERKPKN